MMKIKMLKVIAMALVLALVGAVSVFNFSPAQEAQAMEANRGVQFHNIWYFSDTRSPTFHDYAFDNLGVYHVNREHISHDIPMLIDRIRVAADSGADLIFFETMASTPYDAFNQTFGALSSWGIKIIFINTLEPALMGDTYFLQYVDLHIVTYGLEVLIFDVLNLINIVYRDVLDDCQTLGIVFDPSLYRFKYIIRDRIERRFPGFNINLYFTDSNVCPETFPEEFISQTDYLFSGHLLVVGTTWAGNAGLARAFAYTLYSWGFKPTYHVYIFDPGRFLIRRCGGLAVMSRLSCLEPRPPIFGGRHSICWLCGGYDCENNCPICDPIFWLPVRWVWPCVLTHILFGLDLTVLNNCHCGACLAKSTLIHRPADFRWI